MSTAVNDFLLSLAVAIATATELPIADDHPALFAGNAIEEAAAPVYTVLRIYAGREDGAFAGMRYPIVRIQADTRASDGDAALAQAWKVHESLLDDSGRPRMNWAIEGKVLDADDDDAIGDDEEGSWIVRVVHFLTAPGVVGRDEHKRTTATGNFEVEFERVTAA